MIDDNIKYYILNNYDQVEMFSFYLQIPIEDIQESIKLKRNILNLHRGDTAPSLKFYYDGGKLKVFDYGNVFYRGDIFDIVSLVTGDKGFINSCTHILQKFKPGINNPILTSRKNKYLYTYTFRNYSSKEITYWYNAGITYEHLKNRGILLANEVHRDGVRIHYYNQNNPGFIYILGFQEEELFTLYKPFEKKEFKFTKNYNYPIEGINELYESENLIITKSRKDKLTIESLIDNGNIVKQVSKLVKRLDLPPFQYYSFYVGFYDNTYHINSDYCITNLSSESILLSNKLIDFLKSKHKRIFIFYDYDLTGIINSYFYAKLHSFIPIFIGRPKDKIIEKLTPEIVKLITNKFLEYEIIFEINEFIQFVDFHSGNEESKDMFELANYNINKAKTFLNGLETYKKKT